jgi:short-subunit dehydrogenase
MNVTNDEEMNEVFNEVKNDLKGNGDQLWAVVNNTATVTKSHIEWGALDSYKKEFEVNVFGFVRVTRVFLSLTRNSKGIKKFSKII